MSIQNTKESESKNIEQNKINTKLEKNYENIPKSEILKKYDNYELFLKNIENLEKDKKEKLVNLLSKISDDDLIMYIEINNSGSNLVEFKDINNFIEEYKQLLGSYTKSNSFNLDYKKIEKIEDRTKEEYENKDLKEKEANENVNEDQKNVNEDQKNVNEDQKNKNENQKNKNEDQKFGLKILNEKLPKLRGIFKGDTEIEEILTNIEKNKTNPDEVLKLLNKFFESKERATRFFDKIASSGDKELYESTYNSFKNLGVSIPSYIPREIYEVNKSLPDPRFPDAPEGKVEKRGDLLSYGDKLIDEKTGKAYIIGENGYKLETSLNIPNLTETKVKFQKERLKILESIDNSKNILNLLENKYTIKNRIENLEKQKTGIIGEDTQINIEINLLSKELEQIQNKLKQVVPNYNETQDDLLKSFLEKSIKEDNEKLEKLEEKYTKEIKDLYEKAGSNVKENDEKTRESLNILDSIGFTLIPKNITDDIIATINKNPENYGFESRIDLKNGNFGGINNQLTKERFIKKINKMISSKETEPITTSEIDDILVKKIEKDKNSQEERNKELLGKFSTYGIINDLGIWDKEKLESNLTLKEKETTNKEIK